MSLAGEWEFQVDPSGALDVESIRPDRRIRVPLPWQAAFPDQRRYAGYAWYRRTFDVDGDIAHGDLWLRFGAVDYWCEVFLNGQRLGDHEGGYTPFGFGLRGALVAGRNEIAVRVFDPVQTTVANERWPDVRGQMAAASGGPPFVAAHVPHGKQDWYLNTGGIWQDVTLTPRAATWIERLHVTPDLAHAAVSIEVGLGGDPSASRGPIRLEVLADGWIVAATELASRGDEPPDRTTLDIPAVRPWDVDRPFLYDLVASLDVDGHRTRTKATFGMRTFSTAEGRFLLNGEPLYLRAALDQDFYPETISTVPSRDVLLDTFTKAKALGFNCLRCHIKPPDPMYLDVADELGLLVWEELPSWRTFWPKGSLDPAQTALPKVIRDRVESTLDAVIDRDFNHPSVVIRTLVNEDWGTALALRSEDRAWLRDLHDRAKRADPGRLVVDNSACAAAGGTNFHVVSDIDDFHVYATIPEQARIFDDVVADLALHPSWTFSPFGDAQRRGDEPVVLSEFGNWGLPGLGGPGDPAAEPDWFDVRPWGGGWDQEPGSPAGVAARFDEFGLTSIWPDYDSFAAATQVHQVAALRYQVEALRRRSSIAGYAMTQLTDTYWESNGILDFERRAKAPIATIAAFNADDVLIATADRRSFPSGGEARIELHPSIFGPALDEGSRLTWCVEGQQVQSRPLGTGRSGTQELDAISVRLPDVKTLSYVPISFALVGADGAVRTSTGLRVAVVPTSGPNASLGSVSVISGEIAGPAGARAGGSVSFEDRLQAEGYRVDTLARAADSGVAVADVATPELLDWVRAGGRLLYLVGRRNPFFWVQARGGSAEGWITSFSWLDPAVHGRLRAVANPLGLEFVDVMPERTISGIPFAAAARAGDVLAGMVTGWVHHPTAHTLQFRFGRGRVVMTTFRLAATVGIDPIASAMLHDLIDHLVSERCQPVLAADGTSAADRERSWRPVGSTAAHEREG